jgi:hypothetical protein
LQKIAAEKAAELRSADSPFGFAPGRLKRLAPHYHWAASTHFWVKKPDKIEEQRGS